jgi:hypothetical protein
MDENSVPGFTADPALEAKLNSLDDQLQPIEKDLKDDLPEESIKDQEVTQDTEPFKDTSDTKDEPTEGEDEGYTIDGEEDTEPDEEVLTTSTEEAKSSTNLTAEQQYILDNLQAITVRGTVGADGKVQEFTVLSPEQLPNGFKYIDERESSIANKNFALLESKALTLQSDFRTQQTTKAVQEFKAREDAADISDIAELQKAGDLPKFKLQRNDPKFETDPGVQLVQEVLDFKETQNQKYMDEYNAGRPYKHIGFQEAYAMYKRSNPDTTQAAQKAEDAERKAVAQRTSRTKGASTKTGQTKVHSGMMSRDLDALIESRTQGW